MATYVCGDIHGAKKALEQVIERAPLQGGDRIIFLGDYVDGWPESAQVIEYLLNLDAQDQYECIFILGNHDEWARKWLKFKQDPINWLVQGGQATVDSYVASGLLDNDDHRKFLDGCHMYYIDEENRGFVHGGYKSKRGLGHETYQADYYWDRDLLSLAIMRHNLGMRSDQGTPNEIRSYKHKEVYVGHTTTSQWEQKENGIIKGTDNWRRADVKPIMPLNVIALDTGAGYEGRLTIMNADTKEYWQSDPVKELYPNARGR